MSERHRPHASTPSRRVCSGVLALLALSLTCTRAAVAQSSDQARHSSGSVWVAYVGEHPISSRSTLHLEGQAFWYGAMDTREIMLLRAGWRRELSPGFSALLTYGYFAKYPAITNASTTLSEHRISEDLQWTHGLAHAGSKRATITHRLRAEQRFEGQDDRAKPLDSWQFAQRVRYRLTANVPLPGATAGPRPEYVSIYDEVFVNVGPGRGSQAFDQNLLATAFGWNLRPHLQLEIGYLLAYNPSAHGVVGMYNHVVQINLISTIPFSSRKPSG